MLKHWGLLLIVVAAIACACAIPPTDLPETAYNEVDTPVNHAPAVIPGIRLARPLNTPVIIPKQIAVENHRLAPSGNDAISSALLAHLPNHSANDFLCTLLI